MLVKLSGDAEAALIGARSGREGADTGKGVSREVLTELTAAGMIGPQGGLTRAGVVRRELLSAARLDELFA